MLPKSAKQKGKRLEKYVAKEFKKIYDFVYSRADSGSGKYHKEDITIPDYIPLFIECKNQAEPQIKTWFKKIDENCPAGKYPVLIYKRNYERELKVVMRISDFLNFLSGNRRELKFNFFITLDFKDFLGVCQEVKPLYDKKEREVRKI